MNAKAIKPQTVQVLNVKWDRCARKAIIRIGERKVLLNITFAPAISGEKEMNLFLRINGIQFLDHVHACVIKLHDAKKSIGQMLVDSESSAMDSKDYTIRNPYLNSFLDLVVRIVDPAPDSMKYESYLEDFAKCEDIAPELRKFANKMEMLHQRKKKSLRTKDGESIETQMKEAYRQFYDDLMLPKNDSKLMTIVGKTLESESIYKSDIPLGPVPVIDSATMIEYTERINRYTLAHYPKDAPTDNCGSYYILSPEVLSDPLLLEKVIISIRAVQTKFIVLKIKNFEIDGRKKSEERLAFKHLMDEIIKIKHEHKDDRVFALLEANIEVYLSGLGGFDIISTSMTGYDNDNGFRRSPNKNAINGYFKKDELVFKDQPFILKALNSGGFRHRDCVCSTISDISSARRDWYNTRREHYIRCMNELFADLWKYIDQGKIELAKSIITKSSISNLKQAVPMLDFM